MRPSPRLSDCRKAGAARTRARQFARRPDLERQRLAGRGASLVTIADEGSRRLLGGLRRSSQRVVCRPNEDARRVQLRPHPVVDRKRTAATPPSGFLRRSEHCGALVASGPFVHRGRALAGTGVVRTVAKSSTSMRRWGRPAAPGLIGLPSNELFCRRSTRGLFGLRRGGARPARADDAAQRRLSRHAVPIEAAPGLRGRLAMSRDAGYSVSHVQRCGLVVMEQISGIKTPVSPPFLANLSGDHGQALPPHKTLRSSRQRRLSPGVVYIGSPAIQL